MRRALAAGLALTLAACATSGAFHAGRQAERRQDYDRAVLEYSKAVQGSPDNQGYRLALVRARLRASTEHANTARRLAGRGLYKEALDQYRLALDLNPASPGLSAEMQEVEARREAGLQALSLDKLKEQARERALPGLALGPEAREPLGVAFRNVSLREAYLALGKVAGVNFVFDPQFQDQTISLDLRDVAFEQALAAIASTGRTFHRVVESKIISVIPDTPSKRREYEQQAVKTLFLSNADLKETIDLLRIVLGARKIAPLPGANAITINDTPERVAAAERIVAIVDKRRSEVVVEVEILEVDRSRLRQYGIEITSGIPGTEGVISAIGPDPTKTFTLDDNPYSKESLVVTGLPGVIVRLLESDRSTRVLASPQLRISEGQTAQARFGDQVPVPVTTFTPIASGGISQQPITSFEYKNVGVNIDITPRVHHDGDVTLSLKLDVSAIGAPGFQGLPTFNSRTVNSVIRLKDGETTMIAGLIRDDERKTLSGLPGLASIPVLGRLFSRNQTEVETSDIVMTLTPHVVRRAEISIEDLRSFLVGGEGSPLLFEVPSQSLPTARPTEAPRIEPIRPPSPPPSPAPEQRP